MFSATTLYIALAIAAALAFYVWADAARTRVFDAFVAAAQAGEATVSMADDSMTGTVGAFRFVIVMVMGDNGRRCYDLHVWPDVVSAMRGGYDFSHNARSVNGSSEDAQSAIADIYNRFQQNAKRVVPDKDNTRGLFP